jgi:Putative Ig domain
MLRASHFACFQLRRTLLHTVSAAALCAVVTAHASDVPVISGTPPTSVIAGSTYEFQPSARDPDGKTLSFSVQHKPVWARFSIASGLLDGTPSSSQTGSYSDIIISASNGQYSAALPAFSVTVASPSATIDWLPPTENTNGSQLTDLAGTRIYYGTSASNLNHMVQVASATLKSHTIGNLAAGTWYFGCVAYTLAGTESAMSAVVSKHIP